MIFEAIRDFIGSDLPYDSSFKDEIRRKMGQDDITSDEIENVLNYIRTVLDVEIQKHLL